MTVYAYYRWSTLEQGNSDRSSEDRQRIICDAYAKRMGLTIDHVLIDSGRSAFTGANLKVGELGKLAAKLRSGAVDPKDTILLLEELDRLSRRPPAEMMAWLHPLLLSGLTVHVASGQVITVDSVNRDFGSFLSLMSGAFSAFEFSRKQQDRGNASWTKRRKAAAEGTILSRHRARKWLEWNPTTKGYDPIPERVALIKEMFALRLKGYGKASIAKLFNERAGAGDDGYRVWVSTKKAPDLWTASAIARIVQDDSVLGYIQYTRFPRGADKKVPLGNPVKVYPAIVEEEIFARANDRRLTEQLKYQGRGRAVSNLLGRISKCGTCGGTIAAHGSSRWRTNKDGNKSQHYFLYCSVAKGSKGTTCDNQRGWPYRAIETAIVDKLLTLAIDDTHFRNDDESGTQLEGEVIRIQKKLNDLTASAKRVLALITDDADDDLAPDQYQAIKLAIKDTKAKLGKAQEAFTKAQGKVSPQEHIVRVREVRERMECEDAEQRFEARTLVKAAFGNLIKEIKFSAKSGNVTVHLVDGQRMFVINDGEVIEDWDWPTLHPHEYDEQGRRLGTHHRTYDGGMISIDLETGEHIAGETGPIVRDDTLTGDQTEAAAGYRRRVS